MLNPDALSRATIQEALATTRRCMADAAIKAAAAAAAASATAAATAGEAAPPDKFMSAARSIRMGKAEDAVHGLPVLMGIKATELHAMLAEGEAAIAREIEASGSAKDKANFAAIVAGTYSDDNDECIGLDELVAHPHAVLAKLERYHVLALRLYTTDTHKKINDPLRSNPPQRPHPFAATTYFISEGIKMLRAVAASLKDAHTEQIFWRGMKDVDLTIEFGKNGGTEFACMSTSASIAVAVKFAASKCPLILKYETKDFMNRGADISFLSVHPTEKEALYPPLTYLRAVKTNIETLGGYSVMVATVEPVFA
jgi:hypothetical protein